MPLRGFLYFANLYEKYLSKRDLTLHVNTLVKIPTPNYVVFYNGTSVRSAREIMQITSKIKKGKSLEVIADEVEEAPDAIREIYERLVAELQNA